MNIYEVAKRIKCTRDRECALTRKEGLQAKTIAKYLNAVDKLQVKIKKQQKELNTIQKRIRELTNQNEELEKALMAKKQHLEQYKSQQEQLRQTVQQNWAQQLLNRQQNLKQKQELHTLKDISNTLINLDALPHMIQGVTICENQQTSEWLPFSIAPMRYTIQEGQDLIWKNVQYGSGLNDKWRELFLGFHSADREN